MRTKAGKQNKTLPSGRGRRLRPAVEKLGPLFRLKITGALSPGEGGRRGGAARRPPPTPDDLLPLGAQHRAASTGRGPARARRLPSSAPGAASAGVGAARPANGASRGVFQPELCDTGQSPNLSGPPRLLWGGRGGLSRCPLGYKGKAPQMPPAQAGSRLPAAGPRTRRRHLSCAKFKVCFGGERVVAAG